MGAVTPTAVKNSELAGDYKLAVFSFVPASASDTLTFTLATHGFSEIAAILACEIREGADANLVSAHATFSGLVVTVVTKGADGNAATNWDSAVGVIALLVR